MPSVLPDTDSQRARVCVCCACVLVDGLSACAPDEYQTRFMDAMRRIFEAVDTAEEAVSRSSSPRNSSGALPVGGASGGDATIAADNEGSVPSTWNGGIFGGARQSGSSTLTASFRVAKPGEE